MSTFLGLLLPLLGASVFFPASAFDHHQFEQAVLAVLERGDQTAPRELQLSGHFKATLQVLVRGDVSSPRISGDGNTVAWNQYFPDEQRTSVLRLREGRIERMSSPTYHAMWPDLSHDGKVMAWTATPRGSDWDIERWEQGKTRVVAGTVGLNEYSLRLSGDGSTIVYDRDQHGKFLIFDIFVVREPDAQPVPVATNPSLDEAFPWVSHDGSLLFWRELRRVDGKGVQEFYRLEHGKRVPTLVDGAVNYQPSIDRDARRLLFASNKVDQGGIYLMRDLDPASIEEVAEDEGTLQWYPVLSADGGTMAWSDKVENPEAGLNIWAARGGRSAPVLRHDGSLLAMPSLSADGRKLVFLDLTISHDHVLYLVEFQD
ncbi:MAG: hypothetical protein A2284_02670 [Deltaproteobacteria bacterium RIFOXYA12_FULL_61_11]|nr:MAG: hypothetical protein A2284_02670 [Deltaproteobacteria bacterium RIFOXYA12_FULL_61_11]